MQRIELLNSIVGRNGTITRYVGPMVYTFGPGPLTEPAALAHALGIIGNAAQFDGSLAGAIAQSLLDVQALAESQMPKMRTTVTLFQPSGTKVDTETAAATIYAAMREAASERTGSVPPVWTPGGNSTMQDVARKYASELLEGVTWTENRKSSEITLKINADTSGIEAALARLRNSMAELSAFAPTINESGPQSHDVALPGPEIPSADKYAPSEETALVGLINAFAIYRHHGKGEYPELDPAGVIQAVAAYVRRGNNNAAEYADAICQAYKYANLRRDKIASNVEKLSAAICACNSPAYDNNANLGLASTGELLDELRARAEMQSFPHDGQPGYADPRQERWAGESIDFLRSVLNLEYSTVFPEGKEAAKRAAESLK